MRGLTDKQRGILDFIGDFMDANMMAPTVYEIAEHFNIKTSTVFAHLRSLQKKNYLKRTSKARSISLNKPRRKSRCPNGLRSVPLLEKLDDLSIIRHKGNNEIFYDSSLMKDESDARKLFAIRVEADSMHASGILSGDIAILKKSFNNLKNGDIVLTKVNGVPELRTYRQIDHEHVELAPSSAGHIMVRGRKSELPIHGVLVGLQRSI